MKKQHLGMALGFALWCCSSGAGAQGVLDRVAAGGQLVLAHRESSVPFSYVHQGKPMGYAVDLCLRLAEAVRKKTGMKDMAVAFLQVTPENRMAMVEQGKVDLECGSTTNNAERREKVAFTIPHFITGTRLLMKASSKVTRMEDLAGKKLVSTRGTTAYKVAEKAARERLMGFTLLEAPDHARAVEMVEKGEADAFAMDDVLLYSLAASRPDPKALKVEGRFLTTEALAIALPKQDAAFKKVVDEEMRRLITSREILAIYDKWFMQPIPPQGRALNLPVSYLLRDFWKYPTDQVPF
ncbi:amino acid ABC transporter substrate-binding protein, PAAT family [Paenacidovorax caeni]|uniref:Amino acid ABC transporter substrate-binding protein, PAAT family n=1 Tax=Paenacidovorax caeni TaxID=343013 RepID=A0A1I7J0M0_9BURK|nr:amino acid ABC transporter substrate-binding protein [Paenacidovorax caeni]SFU78738.1 amino acid ABC transporter substrate-binding protein, PAAT family [Paenacidovorax caeni]